MSIIIDIIYFCNINWNVVAFNLSMLGTVLSGLFLKAESRFHLVHYGTFPTSFETIL